MRKINGICPKCEYQICQCKTKKWFKCSLRVSKFIEAESEEEAEEQFSNNVDLGNAIIDIEELDENEEMVKLEKKKK